MKRIFKSRLFFYLLGVITSLSITSVFAYSIFALNIGFTPLDTSWKKQGGEDITNVEDAINNLRQIWSYTKLLWENPDTTVDFPDQTLELDISKYNYVLIETKRYKRDGVDGYNGGLNPQFQFIKVGESSYIMGIDNNYAYHYIRDVTVTSTGITFSKAYSRSYNLSNGSGFIDDAIPVRIYGIKYIE